MKRVATVPRLEAAGIMLRAEPVAHPTVGSFIARYACIRTAAAVSHYSYRLCVVYEFPHIVGDKVPQMLTKISERQLEANRQNAQLSTGPKTVEGKNKVKWNALKHGLLAKSVVVPANGSFEHRYETAIAIRRLECLQTRRQQENIPRPDKRSDRKK